MHLTQTLIWSKHFSLRFEQLFLCIRHDLHHYCSILALSSLKPRHTLSTFEINHLKIWRPHHHQTLFFRVVVHPKDGQSPQGTVGGDLGCPVLALDFESCGFAWEKSPMGHDVRNGPENADGKTDSAPHACRSIPSRLVRPVQPPNRAAMRATGAK